MGTELRRSSIGREQQEDGRWLAEVVGIPGAPAYALKVDEAIEEVEALELRVIADRLEHGKRE